MGVEIHPPVADYSTFLIHEAIEQGFDASKLTPWFNNFSGKLSVAYAYDGDDLVAIACFEDTESMGRMLVWFEVRKDRRGEGLAKKLIDACNGNIACFHSDVLSGLYEKCGFDLMENLRVSVRM